MWCLLWGLIHPQNTSPKRDSHALTTSTGALLSALPLPPGGHSNCFKLFLSVFLWRIQEDQVVSDNMWWMPLSHHSYVVINLCSQLISNPYRDHHWTFLSCLFREKANLAVTLTNEKGDILGHASFFDHPIGDLVDQTQWEAFMQEHFSVGQCTVCTFYSLILT